MNTTMNNIKSKIAEIIAMCIAFSLAAMPLTAYAQEVKSDSGKNLVTIQSDDLDDEEDYDEDGGEEDYYENEYAPKIHVELWDSYYFAYTGEEINPKLYVTIDGEEVDSGYEVIYKNNVEPGEATVTVIYHYDGGVVSDSDTFWIEENDNIIKVDANKSFTVNSGVETTLEIVKSASSTYGVIKYNKISGSDCFFVDEESGKIAVSKNAKPGNYTVVVEPYVKSSSNARYTPADRINITIKVKDNSKPADVVKKSNNTITVKTKNVTLKKKAKKQTIAAKKVFTVKNANGKVTYTKVTSKSSKQVSINKTNGKITVAKNASGKLKLNVNIKAAGDKTHNAKTINKTIKITVKK